MLIKNEEMPTKFFDVQLDPIGENMCLPTINYWRWYLGFYMQKEKCPTVIKSFDFEKN